MHGRIATSWQATQAAYLPHVVEELTDDGQYGVQATATGIKISPEGPDHQQLQQSLNERIREKYDYMEQIRCPLQLPLASVTK